MPLRRVISIQIIPKRSEMILSEVNPFSKEFLSELAVGAGVGLRLDFSILVLRLDLAMPLRVPYYEKGDRWVLDRVKFGDSSWRKDNLILNIAIGYPF